MRSECLELSKKHVENRNLKCHKVVVQKANNKRSYRTPPEVLNVFVYSGILPH